MTKHKEDQLLKFLQKHQPENQYLNKLTAEKIASDIANKVTKADRLILLACGIDWDRPLPLPEEVSEPVTISGPVRKTRKVKLLD